MKFFLKIKKCPQYILTVIVLYFLPIIAGADGLVPCGGELPELPCTYNDLLILVNNVINYLLLNISIPLAAVMFAYAGFLMLTAGGVEEQITKAKQLMWGVLWGLLIAFGAWVIVNTILDALGLQDDWSLLG
ncbi:pilin [Patescibacteria group bacterium]|nr:pilin [Patescibacteria group bacterium]MBU1519237.1 pilin [Patescibacteria group bacterium]MBU2009904.1 pilin [Patescibacteria group bacterium]MBU2416958.1 pilin [Patescibacteria group bacterium]MBU2460689.1 pilin [Patescibacteria group bacterium]